MTLLEEITKQLSALPPEQQTQVLDFIASLQARTDVPERVKSDSLKGHSAFGSWKNRQIDAIQYQQEMRDEWNTQ